MRLQHIGDLATQVRNGSVSVQQFRWHLTAVFGDLPQDGAVQPRVHLCRAVLKSRRRAQLIGEFSSSSSTAIDVEQLEQVDDRGPPVELLRVLGRQLLEVSCDIDRRDRRLR